MSRVSFRDLNPELPDFSAVGHQDRGIINLNTVWSMS